jgi:lysophospholipase L1-like esterase
MGGFEIAPSGHGWSQVLEEGHGFEEDRMPARSRHTRTRQLSVAVVAALLVLAFAAQAAQAAVSPLRYVALGDSYSAASGVLPPDLSAPPQCLRSVLNYPHVIGAATGAQLTDVTCGAAETKDFFESQSPGVAPQLDALRKDTQLVTMTIGGNDSGVFINTILDCGSAGLLTLGQGSPCKDRYGSSFEDTINTTTYPSLVKALKAVRAKAPRAKVAILGYPWIMPPTGGCFDKMPIAGGDVPYVRGIQATLNDAVRRAAAATGATYVNLNIVSNGHDACQPIGVRWVEPVLQGTNPVIVHPNALGESEMAAQTMTVLRLR